MAATVVSVVIFLCGVMVGRGVRADRADSASSVERISPPARRAGSHRSCAGTSGQAAARVGAAESGRRRVHPKRPDRDEPKDTTLGPAGKSAPAAKPAAAAPAPKPAAVEKPRPRPRSPRRPSTPTPARRAACPGCRASRAGHRGVGRFRGPDHRAARSRRGRRHRQASGGEGLSRRTSSIRCRASRRSTACRSAASRSAPRPIGLPAGSRRKSSSAPGLRASPPLRGRSSRSASRATGIRPWRGSPSPRFSSPSPASRPHLADVRSDRSVLGLLTGRRSTSPAPSTGPAASWRNTAGSACRSPRWSRGCSSRTWRCSLRSSRWRCTWRCGSSGRARCSSRPRVWTATEYGRLTIFGGFPWVLLGYSQVTVLPVAQLAAVTGVFGLSWLVAMVSSAAAHATLMRDSRRWMPLAATLAVVAVVAVFGQWRLSDDRLTTAGRPLRVGLIQGNVPAGRQMGAGARGRYLQPVSAPDASGGRPGRRARDLAGVGDTVLLRARSGDRGAAQPCA